jgi:RNA polymerase sigma-70 factor (ECF subfamily)
MRAAPSDEALLTSDDPEAFGVFYARHLPPVQAYFARRVGDRETAADLAAETFASALIARRRFVPGDTPAAGWLYTIAARRLVDSYRRGAVDRRTREIVASERAVAGQHATPESSAIAADLDSGLLRHLPPDQRQAVAARVLEGRDYDEIASELGTSEASIRQRVSRGLSTVRRPLRVYRAAQAVARHDRGYRFGGGHGKPLSTITSREPLDCSSSACLVLMLGGVFAPGPAWVSGELADAWGEPGEGRHVTLWANEEAVWIEFKLDRDHCERFDPTPLRLAPNCGSMSNKRRPTDDCLPRHVPGL